MQFKEPKELRSMNNKELNKEVSHAQKLLNAMVFDHSQKNLKDTSQLGKVRRYVAHVHTIISSRPAPEVTEAAVEAPAKKPKKAPKKSPLKKVKKLKS